MIFPFKKNNTEENCRKAVDYLSACYNKEALPSYKRVMFYLFKDYAPDVLKLAINEATSLEKYLPSKAIMVSYLYEAEKQLYPTKYLPPPTPKEKDVITDVKNLVDFSEYLKENGFNSMTDAIIAGKYQEMKERFKNAR